MGVAISEPERKLLISHSNFPTVARIVVVVNVTVAVGIVFFVQ